MDKWRVPLMGKTMEHFELYRSVFHPDGRTYSNRPLFYTKRGVMENHISESAIRKMLGQYGDNIKKDFPEIEGSVHQHLLRHSRAMHLYQHGMDLTLISQWLGHTFPDNKVTKLLTHDLLQQRLVAIHHIVHHIVA